LLYFRNFSRLVRLGYCTLSIMYIIHKRPRLQFAASDYEKYTNYDITLYR